MEDKELKKYLDLYCKWCPREQECNENLTLEEKRGCLASGGFVAEAIPIIRKAEMERILHKLKKDNFIEGRGWSMGVCSDIEQALSGSNSGKDTKGEQWKLKIQS